MSRSRGLPRAARSGSDLALASAAKSTVKHKHGHKETASKEPFGNIAKGPLQIFISINQQKLHFYSDGVHVADEPVATGVPGHLTPMGVFSVIERDRYHHSNIYSGAPMPFMQRITWSGVALHEGKVSVIRRRTAASACRTNSPRASGSFTRSACA